MLKLKTNEGLIMKFGSYVRDLRKERRLGLREFCMTLGKDPSNWSKIERGVLPPPTEEETLLEIASALDIAKGSDQWYKLFDYASVDRGMLPNDIRSDNEILEKLPVFFRTLRGQKPNEDELKRLIELIKKNV